MTVCCRLTLQGNLGTSSVLSLPIHPSRPAGPSACDPLRPSSTATFATHDREVNLTSDLHPLLSRAFDLLLTLIGQQPAKSRAQPRLQSNAHSTPTGDLSAQDWWKMALCRPVACLLRRTSVRCLSAVARRHYTSSSDEVPETRKGGRCRFMSDTCHPLCILQARPFLFCNHFHYQHAVIIVEDQ